MPQHRTKIATSIAGEFLSRSFTSGETIAILLRRVSPTVTVQRIVTLECALAPRYLGWLASENATGANVYVAANPLQAGSKKRRKESIARIRHLYLDLDVDAESKLAALRSSATVPIPNAIVSTSPGKSQVLWRVEGFSFEQQESMLKLLAIVFGGDPACTDCNRVLRLPGFLNQKYDPAHSVSVEYTSDSTSTPAEFRLDIAAPEGSLIPGPIWPRKLNGKRSNSEHDWAWVLHELAHGKDAAKLTRALAERRSDKLNPLYYAQRTVDIASARLWLLEGVPMTDVITMLQVRRRFEIPTALCHARACEIALTAQRMIVRKKIA
jgi:RepB DNA-primase from phage plasmid